MYKLYWHPNTSSLAPMAILEELGEPFDLHQLDYDGGETHTLAYLKLQPLGLIPALEQWQVVEDALRRDGPWLLGERFSACDIYLQMMTTWHETPRDLLGAFPAIHALARSVVALDACRRAIGRHNFETGLD